MNINSLVIISGHWFSGKESTCQGRRLRFDPWVGKIPWRKEGQPTAAFLPGESQRQRSLAGCSPWGHKESDMTEHMMTTETRKGTGSLEVKVKVFVT